MDTSAFKNAYFLVEGGKALQLVREHIAERNRVATAVSALATELGVSRGPIDRRTGVMLGAVFSGENHQDFKKPDRHGVSYPRKGSAWAQRLKQQHGHADQSQLIAVAFDIPLSIQYAGRYSDGNEYEGSRIIGSPLAECGFLWLSPEGPYAMWTPDVPGIVAAAQAAGETVTCGAASFELEFDGCKRIRKEEWEIMVLQYKMQKAA